MRHGPTATAIKTRLVIAPQWVGDAIMAAPMMASLARSGPLDVICLPGLQALFGQMPFVRHVLPMDFQRGQLQWSERRAKAQTLGPSQYDQAIVCPNSWKSALLPWFAGIPQRTGLIGEWRFGLLNDIRKPHRRKPSQPDQYDALADNPELVRSYRSHGLPPHDLASSETLIRVTDAHGVPPAGMATCYRTVSNKSVESTDCNTQGSGPSAKRQKSGVRFVYVCKLRGSIFRSF